MIVYNDKHSREKTEGADQQLIKNMGNQQTPFQQQQKQNKQTQNN